MPLEATQHTPRGAKAFAVFFIKTIDWGYATTSSAYMRHYFGHSCIGCISTARALDRAERLRRHFAGDRFTAIRVMTNRQPSGMTADLTLMFTVTAGETLNDRGKAIAGEPTLSNFKERTTCAWQGGRWFVTGFVRH